MSRTLKRVSVNFKWPTGKKWVGYINPYHGADCTECDGGYNEATQKIYDEWYSFDNQSYLPNPHREGSRYNIAAWHNNLTQEDVDALVKADRLWDLIRVPINEEQVEVVKKKIASGENSWLPYSNGRKLTPEIVNEWNLQGLGHDGINCSVCVTARAKREGVYGFCTTCKGENNIFGSKEHKKRYDEFETFEPPKGRGYQLWETTSEGSPSSPVFRTFAELCQWCEDGATTFGRHTATKEEWAKMLDQDFVYHKDEKLGVIFM